MRIEKFDNVKSVYFETNRNPVEKGVEAKSTTSYSKIEEMNVTPKEFVSFLEMAKQDVSSREAKVEALKEQIENGTYYVSGKDIVESIFGGVEYD